MTVVTLHGKEYRLAAPGLSGAVCRRCSTGLTVQQAAGKQFHEGCPQCGFANWDALNVFEVRAMDSMKMFFDDEFTQTSVWFHASTQKDWHQNVLNSDSKHLAAAYNVPVDSDFTPMVHLGTLDAALERAEDLDPIYTDDGKTVTWYIHEVRLNSDAKLSPFVVEGEDCDSPDHVFQSGDNAQGFSSEYLTEGITRYINSYESTGSISLLANPKVFTVTATHQL